MARTSSAIMTSTTGFGLRTPPLGVEHSTQDYIMHYPAKRHLDRCTLCRPCWSSDRIFVRI